MRPEPRPALQRADDGGVHPASPRAAPERHIHPAPHAPTAPATEHPGTKPDTQTASTKPAPVVFAGKQVTVTVEMPKTLRKRVRKVAERDGRTVDDVVVDALTRYLVG